MRDRDGVGSRAAVQILLSTYNGAAYVEEQLESFTGQTHPAWTLAVRDDGSTDETIRLIERHRDRLPGLILRRESNVGVVSSFFRLLEQADPAAAYYAFSDQDDVWPESKLARAVEMLDAHDPGRPLLYAGRLEYVDASLAHLGYSDVPRRIGFPNALVENVATGCSVVMNRAARERILSAVPTRAIMHDWWFYLVVSAFGLVIYDSRPAVRYRQHAGNVVGAAASRIESLRRRSLRFLRARDGVFRATDQAAEFDRLFGADLGETESRILRRFLDSRRGLASRLRYALTKSVHRNRSLDDLILRALIALGRY